MIAPFVRIPTAAVPPVDCPVRVVVTRTVRDSFPCLNGAGTMACEKMTGAAVTLEIVTKQ